MARDDLFRVLVVDDDPDVRHITARVLQRQGYLVHTAEDGRAALRLVREHRPHLVVLDVVMDDLDGLDTCRRIKQGQDDPPLVVLASNLRVEEKDRVDGLQCGADGYLTRPVSNVELRAHVAAFERIWRASQVREERRGTTERDRWIVQLEREHQLRAEMEVDLVRLTELVEEQQQKLSERALALRVLTDHMRDERRELEEAVAHNLRTRIQPLLRRLVDGSGPLAEDPLVALDEQLKQLSEAFSARLDDPALGLTPREKEVCALVHAGRSSKEIAGLLGVSVNTVSSHRRRIRRKLHLEERASLEEALGALERS